MGYKSLKECAIDLEKRAMLVRIKTEVDPNLEMAAIHRRVFEMGGPALLFENIKGSKFPALSNLYGTFERTEFLFRDTMPKVQKVIELKADPARFLKNPMRYWSAPFTALSALPKRKRFNVPVFYQKTRIQDLPLIKSWPMDGGAFITLPQVCTLPPGDNNAMHSNIGMYRIQLNGNDYLLDKEIGLHYQLHRGIGVHHTQYNASEEPFRASIFVGGPPSHAFAAIMPLPEGLSEMTFAGMLAGRRFGYARKNGFLISADADFVITGIIKKGIKKPEGPFGDHLGYYSLKHDFPVMEVENVYHRKDAIWHFSVVGRPPQEDSSFGYLIHQLVKPLTSNEFPGIKEINAVDEAGVHPLLLAIGSERYMPFRDRKPEEILTQANHLLGKGQTSLAKYLFIAADGDQKDLSTKDTQKFFDHLLSRIDLNRDLHFYTKTTMDTLDYSGSGWNEGSKLVVACCGNPIRNLSSSLPEYFSLPEGFSNPRFVQPGILAIEAPKWISAAEGALQVETLVGKLEKLKMAEIPLIVLVEDSDFCAQSQKNFLWVAFTRSNPSHDIYGLHSQFENKHWGCRDSLIIDARIKTHHAPVLEEDPQVKERVDKLFARGGALSHL